MNGKRLLGSYHSMGIVFPRILIVCGWMGGGGGAGDPVGCHPLLLSSL